LLFAQSVEVLFKRHFWIVHLLFMLAVAWLVMRTANAFVEISLLPLPTGRAGPAPIAKVTPVAALNLDRVARALGLPVPKPEPVVVEAPAPVAAAPVAPPAPVAAPEPDGFFGKILGLFRRKAANESVAAEAGADAPPGDDDAPAAASGAVRRGGSEPSSESSMGYARARLARAWSAARRQPPGLARRG
jgi:hypothetical protein